MEELVYFLRAATTWWLVLWTGLGAATMTAVEKWRNRPLSLRAYLKWCAIGLPIVIIPITLHKTYLDLQKLKKIVEAQRPRFALETDPVFSPVKEEDRPAFGGAAFLHVETRNQGNRDAIQPLARGIFIDQSFASSANVQEVSSSNPIQAGKPFSPSWKKLGFRDDEDPMFFVLLLKYRDSYDDASYVQEWCFRWRGAKSGRIIAKFLNCSIEEGALLHTRLDKKLLAFQ